MSAKRTAAKKSARRNGSAGPAGRRAKKKKPARELMEAGCLIEETRPLDENLRSRVIGQDDAISTLTCCYSRLLAGLGDPARPWREFLADLNDREKVR